MKCLRGLTYCYAREHTNSGHGEILTRRTKLALLIAATLAALVLVPLLFAPDSDESGDYHVGAVLPLSGNVSVFGNWMREGISLRLARLAEEDSVLRERIQLHYRDSQNDASTGLSAFRQLVSVRSIDAAIGAMSRVSLPLIPVADERQIPLLLQDVTYPNVTGRSPYVFRHFIQSDREASQLANYAVDSLGASRIALLSVNDEAGVGAAESFTRELTGTPASVVSEARYGSDETEFGTVVARLLSSDPDVVFHFGNGPSWARAMRAIERTGFEGDVLTNTAMYIPTFRELAGGEATEGVYFTYPPIDTTAPAARRLLDAFRRDHQGLPPLETAYGYDLTQLLITAMEDGDRPLVDALASLETFPSVFGDVTVTEEGDVLTPVAIARIRAGEVQKIRIDAP